MEFLRTFKEFLQKLKNQPNQEKVLNDLEGSVWVSYSMPETLSLIRAIALGLQTIGFKKGDTALIFAHPSSKWTIVDFAIKSIGGVSVPVFINISPENFEFQARQTEAKYIFVDGTHISDIAYQKRVLADNKSLFTSIIPMNNTPDYKLSFDKLAVMGFLEHEKSPALFDELVDNVKAEDMACVVYTSGSTGVPKGAEYSHERILAFSRSHFFGINETDRFLSVLPLAHIYGYIMNQASLFFNVQIYFINDVKMLSQAAKEIHPTIIIVVPRLLEKLYTKLLTNIENQGFMKKTLGTWAFELAKHDDGHDQDYFTKHLLHSFADMLIYSKFREVLGGAIRIMISGSAPLSPLLQNFFNSVGIPIYEGYGMTEACPITINQQGARRVGSVGRPLKVFDVRVSDEGELHVKGIATMSRYYKNPEATAKMLTEDMWLKTGDKVRIDSDGYVYIVGRLKEVYKTSTGEFVVPVPIEQELIKAPLIEMATVIAEGRKFTSVLLFPEKEVLHSIKKAHNAEDVSDEEFLRSDFIKTETDNLIAEINKHLNKCEQILEYRYVPTSLTVESGELTPTLKIRRDVVTQKYAKLIDSMYNQEVNYGSST